MKTIEQLELGVKQLNDELEAVHRIAQELERRPPKVSPFTLLVTTTAAAVALVLLVGATSKKPAPLTVMAPFRVVDSANKTIFHVQEEGSQLFIPIEQRHEKDEAKVLPSFNTRGAFLLDSSQNIVAYMTVGPGGGMVKVSNKQNLETAVAMAAFDDAVGVKIKEKDKALVWMGRSAGGSSVAVYNSEEKPVAGLATDRGRGSAAVYNAKGHGVAYLTEGDGGAGVLEVLDAAGLVAFYAHGSKTGGAACINRNAREFCIGPDVSFGK